MNESTIAAISTAYGEAGIGIVRMSGDKALSIASAIFECAKSDNCFVPRYMNYGRIKDPADGHIIDEVLCVYMKAPHTYTGEDVVEIQCHGSLVSLKNILELCFRLGAEPAQRGEFTKRAFLNGRLDLAQAEAVMDIISAKAQRSFDIAMDQMNGALSHTINDIRAKLLDELVSLTVNMDYPDEDIEEITYDKLKTAVSAILSELKALAESASAAQMIKEGLKTAIVGRPNVGKSSLLNYLLKRNRSIVTDIPGTTRDTIEEIANIRGIPVLLTDTAGIRESNDAIESMGIERSKRAFDASDMIMIVLDGSCPLCPEDAGLFEMAAGRNILVVINKSDLAPALKKEDIPQKGAWQRVVTVSAKEGLGMEAIGDAIEAFAGIGEYDGGREALLCSERHILLVSKAIGELEQALDEISRGSALDFVEINVRAAFDFLGEIIGQTASDEVINEVFERFCLGK